MKTKLVTLTDRMGNTMTVRATAARDKAWWHISARQASRIDRVLVGGYYEQGIGKRGEDEYVLPA